MRIVLHVLIANLIFISLYGCGSGNDPAPVQYPAIVVNNLEDTAEPGADVITLRSALATARSGQSITFDESLDGGTIRLSNVGEAHAILKGEVMGMRMEPSGPVSYLVGYFDRDYGRSALYARKDVVIDASALPTGITIAWSPGDAGDARVMAVYGNLTMTNVTITGGRSVAEDISTDNPDDQPWTLARGGALAVWGTARLVDCTIFDNHCFGDFDQSRDRGAFGGGLYANRVDLRNCVISANSVTGAGAAGGGVYSVGGADDNLDAGSQIEQSAITGNRIRGLFVYGAGIFSDGGSIGHGKSLVLRNCTIARNLAEPSPGLPAFLLGMGYWRGSGVYMSNGYLSIRHCTIVENAVYGYPRTDDLGKPNLAGGVAATIGNAHAVEDMVIGQSIIAGNTVFELSAADGSVANAYAQDIFTGSLFGFKSLGFNRFGVIDFSQMLAPVGERYWRSLCRRHYPKTGDQDRIDVADVLNLTVGVTTSSGIVSAGVDPGEPVAIWYEPAGSALDRVPLAPYSVDEVYAEYEVPDNAANNFLNIVLQRAEALFGMDGFAAGFTSDFESFLQSVDTDSETIGLQPYTDPDDHLILTLTETQWFGPGVTWPRELFNHPYIHFWHRLDEALLAENIPGMGFEVIGDDGWSTLFSSGPLAENRSINMVVGRLDFLVSPTQDDQLGRSRDGGAGEIGAVEAVQ